MGEKNKGTKKVEWKLSKEQKEFIEKIGFLVEPKLYEIETKTFKRISSIDIKILKDLHYANKKGKKFLSRELSKEQRKTLQSYGISYHVIKYTIYL